MLEGFATKMAFGVKTSRTDSEIRRFVTLGSGLEARPRVAAPRHS